MNRTTRFRLVATLSLCGAVAACALDPLNPQPLPPSPEVGFGFDAGAIGTRDASGPSVPASETDQDGDSAVPPPQGDAGATDAGDAASDAGDAASDADADATGS